MLNDIYRNLEGRVSILELSDNAFSRTSEKSATMVSC
jgi:hypothetical protein